MKAHKPKSIKEAINDFQDFLECDLYTRFRPAQTLPIGKNGKDETWFRDSKDVFKSERDFLKYLDIHFNIFRKQVIKLKKNGDNTLKEVQEIIRTFKGISSQSRKRLLDKLGDKNDK